MTFLGLRIGLGAVALAWSFCAQAADAAPQDLVFVRHGSLPIILAVPHGGRLDMPGVPPRTPPEPAQRAAFSHWGGFQAGGDPNTDALALRMAAEIERLTGQAPYIVQARFKRKFVDVNRPAELAYGDPAAAPSYALYHDTLRRFVDEIRRVHSAGLLLDLHGEAKNPDVIMRGTSNGNTVKLLVRRAGAEAITGPNGLFGQLEAQGFSVFPSNHLPLGRGSEDAGFNGGFTVNHYGSQNPDGIDAVQLEFGTRYRRDEELDNSATKAARAIVAFYKTYLAAARKDQR